MVAEQRKCLAHNNYQVCWDPGLCHIPRPGPGPGVSVCHTSPDHNIYTITACNLLQIIDWQLVLLLPASMLVALLSLLTIFWLWKWSSCHILTRLPSVCLAPDLLFAPKLLLIERQVRSGWYNTYLHLRTQISLTSSTMSHGISLLQQNTSISMSYLLTLKILAWKLWIPFTWLQIQKD